MKSRKILISRNYIIAALGLVFITFSVIFSSFLTIYTKTKRECWNRLEEIAQVADDNITASITSYLSHIASMSSVAYLYDDLKDPQAVGYIKKIQVGPLHSPIRLYLKDGFAVIDGKTYDDYTKYVSWASLYCEETMMSSTKKDYFDNSRYIMEVKHPVRKNGSIIGIISCAIDLKQLENFIYDITKDKKVFILLLDRKDDTIFVDTDHKKISNIYSFSNRTPKRKAELQTFVQNMHAGKPAQVVILSKRTGKTKYLFETPSKIQSWTIIAEMDEVDVFSSLIFIRKIYLILFFILSTLFILATLFVYIRTKKQLSKESLEYTEIANALSSNYECIYYVNTTDNSYRVFNSSGDFNKLNLTYPGKDFFKEMYDNLINLTYSDDRFILINFTDKEKLIQELKNGSYVTAIYRLIVENKPKYFRMKVAESKTDSDHIIVALENVDAEIKKEQDVQMQSMSIIQSLSDEYELIYFVEAESGKYELHGSNSEYSNSILRKRGFGDDFFKDCASSIDEFIYDLDRNEAREFFTREYFSHILKNSKTAFLDARCLVNGKPVWYRHKLVESKDIHDKTVFIIGISNIEEQKQQEIKKQMNDEIISILASYYSSVYYIDLNTEKIIPYSKNDDTPLGFNEIFTQDLKFSDAFSKYVSEFVYEEDRDSLLRTCSIKNIKNQLSTQKAFISNYRNSISGITHYSEIKFVKVGDIGDTPTAVVLGIANRDEEILNRFVDNRLYEDYLGIFYVNLEDDRIRTIKQSKKTGLPDIKDNSVFSEIFELLAEYTTPEFYGECVHLLKSDDSLDYFKNANKREINFKSFTNQWRRATIFIVERKDNIPIGFIFTIMELDDQTANKIEYDAKIADQNAILEKQQILLEQSLANAEAANNAKTAFLNNMSHDIRTPMNAIIGFTELAKKDYKDSEKVKDYLSKLSTSSTHLLGLINNVLDMSRIESGKASLNEEVDNLTSIITYIHDILTPEVENKKQTFIIEANNILHENIFVDRLRLNRILLNMLSNSIKFTKEGGTISLTVNENASQTKGYANYEFIISDNGMGMNEEFLKIIFDPFTRARNSTNSGIQGTGLGMAITKNLVDLMNGTIDIESHENEGTKTVVRFTFAISEPVEFKSSNSDASKNISLDGMKVLLVDDNDFNREIANLILTDKGIFVDEATSGKEAIEKVEHCNDDVYDLILMDIQMPEMDGYEVTKKIRSLSNKKLADIPIVAMTANAFEEDRQLSLKAGMNDHIAKPLNIQKLTAVLEKYL